MASACATDTPVTLCIVQSSYRDGDKPSKSEIVLLKCKALNLVKRKRLTEKEGEAVK